MSDRINGFYVALDRDMRDDDFEYIKNAVLMIKGVYRIKENVDNIDDFIMRSRIHDEIQDDVYALLNKIRNGVKI